MKAIKISSKVDEDLAIHARLVERFGGPGGGTDRRSAPGGLTGTAAADDHRVVSTLRTAMFLIVVVAWAVPSPAAERLLYSRADVETAVVGETSLRRASTVRLELPATECPSGEPFECTADLIYGQVYEIGLVEETSTRLPSGAAQVDRVDQGRVWVALDLGTSDATALDDALVEHLAGLGAAVFVKPWAGMRYIDEPLSQSTFVRSSTPAWACFEHDGEYRFDVVVGVDGRFRMSASRGGETAESVCRAIERAMATPGERVFRTMPDVRVQIRHRVLVTEVSTTDPLTWADRLMTIPAEVTFEKKRLDDDEKTGGLRDRRDGVFRGREGRYQSIERSVLIPPAELDLLGMPMWAARWSFETVHETFGTDAVVERESERSLVSAILPVADPLMERVERAQTTIDVPARALTDRIVERLRAGTDLEPGLVSSALADARAWPAGGDWLIVTCEEDGSARYGIAPFADAAPVVNPRDACAAIRRELGPAR